MAKLAPYRKKRDFTVTAEPHGEPARAKGNAFVIQKHAARRLHYDFRLELDGVLKSWAVTRGPSLVAGERRLAVHVEDHPIEYAGFEGTIPKGEYGGGTVLIWDRGTWLPVGDAGKGLAKGHLEFELRGEKLTGRWDLVRMHAKSGEKRDNWLLIKREDEAAVPPGTVDVLKTHPESVITGRNIDNTASEAPGWSAKTIEPRAGHDPTTLKGARKSPLPAFVPPVLATLAAKPPRSDTWIHEIKFDGYRIQVRIGTEGITLLTRSGLDWTRKFGKPILAALQALPVQTAIIDGELVVETRSGASDFSALQADLHDKRSDRFIFYAFDLLYLDGYDLRSLPLLDRKALLAPLVGSDGIIRFSSHFGDDGAMVLKHACRLSLEGVVSKRLDAPYRSGRSKDWIKSKCSARQEFVVGGFTNASSSRTAIGSLILGIYQNGELHHVGRVGTGFSAKVAKDLFKTLTRLQTDEETFATPLTATESRQAHYVRPALVAEVEFRAWTADGHLRHASFRGLREDKSAQEVVGETPANAKAKKPQRRTVRLTHPDRPYWPEDGVTKEGLADYYAEVWINIAPFIAGRPLALLRCPTGITGHHFFQKHAWKGLNPNIFQVGDPATRSAEPFVAINTLDGLLGLVQVAVLEIHPWGSTLADWDRPDTITMDLDPGDDVPFTRVIEAAIEVRNRLAQFQLTAFVKTSGGKGLHVVVPLKPKVGWPRVKEFTRAIATAMANDSPNKYVATIAKAKRHGKILIDYLRNQRGMTAVAAYSTRARPGATVAMPIAWSDLTPRLDPANFTVANAPRYLAARKSDPWHDFHRAAAPAPSSRFK